MSSIWLMFLRSKWRTDYIANTLQSQLFRSDLVAVRVGMYDTVVVHVYKMNGTRLRYEYRLEMSTRHIVDDITRRNAR